jgi:4-amino-4-deoxy-L-arabinose transferase-like glycosyltransferase
VLAGFLLSACLFVGLGAIGLVGPDEPRYASIARTMAQTGDWVTPRLWGHPWFEKPILYYWAAAASFKLFGVSEATARLPDALAALFGALLLALAAWRLWGGRAARLALVIFPTSIGIFAFARAATMDMLLAVSLEAAMVAALFVLSQEAPPARSWRKRGWKLKPPWALALVGACIGLGT